MKVVMGLPPKQSSGSVAIDLELFGANPDQLHRPAGELACAQFCPDGKTAYIVTKSSDLEKALRRVDGAEWVFHNAGFDVPHLRRWADVPIHAHWDTYVIERILWSGWYDEFGLGHLARRYLGRVLKKDIRKKFYQQGELTDEMIQYAATDAVATWKIKQAQDKLLTPALRNIWEEIDAPAFWAIQDMKGFKLNVRAWLELAKEQAALYERIVADLGFNPISPPQTKKALAEVGLHVPSTGEEIIAPFAAKYPLVQKILDARGAKKMAGTYGKEFCDKYVEADGCVHSNYNTVGAVTGRMSSDDPNGQNLPRDLRYRGCFISPRGWRLVIADVAQQEPRVTAQLSRDPRLIRAIANGEDLHWFVARQIFGLPDDAPIDKDLRFLGKTINLGMVYGLTAYGLAAKANISEHEAERLLGIYFQRFSGIANWMQASRRKARETGKIETLLGRIHHLNLWFRQSMNHAVNSPVQGSAADIIKLSLVYMHRIYKEALPVVAIVHDELVCCVRTGDVKKVSRDVEDCMTRAFRRVAPDAPTVNLVDLHVGGSWASKN